MLTSKILALWGLRSTGVRIIIAKSVFNSKDDGSCIVGSTVYGSTRDCCKECFLWSRGRYLGCGVYGLRVYASLLQRVFLMVKTIVVALSGLRSTRLRVIVAKSACNGKEEGTWVLGSTVYGSTHDCCKECF